MKINEKLILIDSFGRVAKKLRISVTDRCNFTCIFCMPSQPIWIPKSEILTFEEIERLVRIFVDLGIEKVKLTGGEPLVRNDIELLIEKISNIQGIKSISITTNGYFLPDKAFKLKEAGLKSVTISFHSLDKEKFNSVVGKNVYERVLKGIDTALDAGFESVKMNTVIIRGYNENEILDLIEFARDRNLILRFIEYMPFDGLHLWDLSKVVTGKEILDIIKKKYDFEEKPRENGSTSQNYRFKDGKGEFGIITSISRPFCSDCDRIRLKADGKLVPCMFSKDEYDLKTPLRKGASDEEIKNLIRTYYYRKFAGVEKLINAQLLPKHIRPMHTIGG
jgi:molybdenum cofactor biosynthesis protein A, bacterial